MGINVMSRRPRTSPTLPYPPSSSRCMTDAYQSTSKSLTPHRKHHKLLKDGSEVWSEDVEKIFVQGLRQYWESPWATYSRGRSRWRNQFLVEHLKRAGIERTKKQVASHIQVLRNMWRGEPEFHLVAGGEELFQENGLLASPSSQAMSSSPDMHKMQDARSSSSTASTPDFSSPELTSKLPQLTLPISTSPPQVYETTPHTKPSAPAVPIVFTSHLGSPPPSPPKHRITAPVKLEPLQMDPGLSSFSSSGPHSALAPSPADPSPLFSNKEPPNTLRALSLWAEGMPMFTADVDKVSLAMYAQPPDEHSTSVLLRVILSISSIDDMHSSPNLHGFHAAVSFSSRWKSEARCVTRLYSGQVCVSSEVAFFDEPTVIPGGVQCALPESSLSRCKWLDSTSHETITQQVVLDGVIVAAFVYHLQRTVIPGSAPSAGLMGFQRYKPNNSWRKAPPKPFSPPLQSLDAVPPPSNNLVMGTYPMPAYPQPSPVPGASRDWSDFNPSGLPTPALSPPNLTSGSEGLFNHQLYQ